MQECGGQRRTWGTLPCSSLFDSPETGSLTEPRAGLVALKPQGFSSAQSPPGTGIPGVCAAVPHLLCWFWGSKLRASGLWSRWSYPPSFSSALRIEFFQLEVPCLADAALVAVPSVLGSQVLGSQVLCLGRASAGLHFTLPFWAPPAHTDHRLGFSLPSQGRLISLTISPVAHHGARGQGGSPLRLSHAP